MLFHRYTLPPLFEPDLTAKSDTNGGNLRAAFAGDVADVTALAVVNSDLAPMGRISSAMLLS